jgi:tetratricopeptide (TPR) repeat protein
MMSALLPRKRRAHWVAALLCVPLAACAQNIAVEPATPIPPASGAALPGQELTEPLLYEFLLGEIALQRGSAGLAAQTYLDLARRTRDPRVARRAVEMASFARMQSLALEAAQLWQETEPGSARALQTVTALMIGARRVEEAEPYLLKLLSAQGTNAANGFMQLGRLLNPNPDKAANLKVVRRLAEHFPQLPQAHFAVAQAAYVANQDGVAIEEIRRAVALRPDWEAAVVFEAQILQRRAPGEAVKRLGDYLEKHPASREVRMSYARALAGDKRFDEARAQFEKLLADSPGDADATYAVGLLAFQLKDYDSASRYMKQLLGSGYRDPNQVRYVLGQVAEERKAWPEAIDWYRQIKGGEHAMAARLRTAHALSKQGKVDEARAYLRAVSADNQEQRVQLIVAEAQLLREANRVREAFDMLGEALRAQPDQPDLLYDIALTAEKLDRFDVLETNLRRLIELRPDHAHAYNALGYSLADRNQRLPEARKLIERALELSPDDHFIIDSMGWVLYREGDLKAAIDYLRRAYTGRPDAEIGAHLGEVLWMNGERAEAERVWRETQNNHPENEVLLKTLKRFLP